MRTSKINAIRAIVVDERCKVIIELKNGKEYQVINDIGENIDHWVNLKALDLKTCLTY